MKKKFSFIILTLLALSIFIGCAPTTGDTEPNVIMDTESNAEPDATPEQKAEDPIEVLFSKKIEKYTGDKIIAIDEFKSIEIDSNSVYEIPASFFASGRKFMINIDTSSDNPFIKLCLDDSDIIECHMTNSKYILFGYNYKSSEVYDLNKLRDLLKNKLFFLYNEIEGQTN